MPITSRPNADRCGVEVTPRNRRVQEQSRKAWWFGEGEASESEPLEAEKRPDLVSTTLTGYWV